ncbi:MAG: hypothetical protein CSA81_06090 [Acidobacteria bacterium]|nr:MAG: hypothetical protein CSA81_06090 [Acidobacteriota bacterium]PIE89625.1 MAG: hypothetical protein CR997_10450 [Acidobacteriota bacterium]
MKNKTKQNWLHWLADPVVFFYSCSWLLVLVAWGTVAQKWLGLYTAQQKFFASWIFMAGPVPLPGGRLTMVVLFINLFVYLILKRSLKNSPGLYITHLGALLLLLGGFLTAYFSSEGTMVIKEGETARYVSDYHKRELILVKPGTKEDQVTAFAMGWLKAGEKLKHKSLPGTITVLESYSNCDVRKRDQQDPQFKGFGSQFEVFPLPDEPEHEKNMFGIVISVTGFGSKSDGKYAIVEYMNEPASIGLFQCSLRKERTYLPFSLELLDFEKQLHPGTNMPRSFKSVVNLLEDGHKRRVVIQMNEPLRHHGYTFFQSSFIEGSQADSTVLAAVKNYGRQFPYVSSIIMCAGLLIYLIQHVPTLIKNKRRKEV